MQSAIDFTSLGLSPIIFEIGPFALRWYSLSYIVGILFGWWLFVRLVRQPGAPASQQHVDAWVTWITLAVIIGGRIGYVLFYEPAKFAADPLAILRLWEGGMSFHGGFLGVVVAAILFTRTNGISFLRFADYLAVCMPPAIGLVRVANFINGELWGKTTDVPWGMVFPGAGPLPRHPSQLYEAILEGPVLFAILWYLFWRSDARYYPGRLAGAFVFGYGTFRFIVEFFRESDAQLMEFAERTGLHMGQWLSLPMILVGLYFLLTSKGRRQRVEPIAGGVAQQ
jgi:phosphatidylglycerol:prolipoprotein diacylglycerol transferase